MSTATRASENLLLRFSLENPIITGLALMVVALGFKFIDHFVLRLDERLGEIILSKSLGFLLVVAFLWLAGRSLRDIGLRSRFLGRSASIAVIATVLAFAVGYAVEYLIQAVDAARPALLFDAIDSKAGVSGGILFGIWLLLGNFINSFMEEGLFRGVMIRLFRVKLSFWRANLLQALLFGIWHLPWVLKYIQLGTITSSGEIMFSAFSNSVPQFIMGIVWGYLFLKTGNLWAPWIAHVLANSIGNLIHITSLNGLDPGFEIRMVTYTVAIALAMLLVRYVAQRAHMPEPKPWGSWSG